jgi:hypothetical protein
VSISLISCLVSITEVGTADDNSARDRLGSFLGGRNVSNWKAERDAFVSETMAFVEAVRSQRPISTEAVDTARRLPLGVPEHFQKPAPTVSQGAHVVSDETAEQPRFELMKWDGSAREEIRQRIATFKAHQQRFTREREDYALSTLLRVQGGITAPRPDAPKRKV